MEILVFYRRNAKIRPNSPLLKRFREDSDDFGMFRVTDTQNEFPGTISLPVPVANRYLIMEGSRSHMIGVLCNRNPGLSHAVAAAVIDERCPVPPAPVAEETEPTTVDAMQTVQPLERVGS